MTDVWACSQCRSLNQARNDRCYKCRTPRKVGSVAPTDLPTVGPTSAPKPATRYRSSAFRGVIASAFIVSFAIIAVVNTAATTPVIAPVARGNEAVAKTALPMVLTLSTLLYAAGAGALVTFAAWLSRAVDNLPALTGYYPRATPRIAFLECLVPILNFFWVPSILREILAAQDPDRNGNAVIAAAVLPLIGSLFLAFAGNRAISLFLIGSRDVKDSLNMYALLWQVVVGISAVGCVMLVVVISRVERTAGARARAAAATSA